MIQLGGWDAVGHPALPLAGALVGAAPIFRYRPRPSPRPRPRRREDDLPARPGLRTPARAQSAGGRYRPAAPRSSGDYEPRQADSSLTRVVADGTASTRYTGIRSPQTSLLP